MDNLVLAVAIIGLLGVGAQWLAWRFNFPGIVLMSIAGVLAGPVFGVFTPADAPPGAPLVIFAGELGGALAWQMVQPIIGRDRDSVAIARDGGGVHGVSSSSSGSGSSKSVISATM